MSVLLPGTYVNDGVHVFFGQPPRLRTTQRGLITSRWTGGVAPRTGGEGEEVRHVPPVHTWPAWHDIRHPPQLAVSLEVSTHFPKQNICPTGHCRPCAFAANWVMQRNRPIVSPATKARPGVLRPLRKALLLISGQTRVSVGGHRIPAGRKGAIQ